MGVSSIPASSSSIWHSWLYYSKDFEHVLRAKRLPCQLEYGRLCNPNHPLITEQQAEAYLKVDVSGALNATLRYCPVLAKKSQYRLAAIVDFTFNLGAGRLKTSTLRWRLNQRDWASAAAELRRWIYGGGRAPPSLVKRKNEEVMLLFASGTQWGNRVLNSTEGSDLAIAQS